MLKTERPAAQIAGREAPEEGRGQEQESVPERGADPRGRTTFESHLGGALQHL